MSELKIAIPNKGRLSEKIYDLLSKAGLNFPSKSERTLHVTTLDNKYTIIFVRTQDIPKFVEKNVADVGFTGADIVEELKCNVKKIMDLDFGYCEMVVAIRDEDNINCVNDLPENIKIATSFPNISKEYFENIGKKAQIIEVSGACEIAPRLGLCDVVVDITSTGATLQSNKLKIIDKIFTSNAVVIASGNLSEEKMNKCSSLVRALKSVIDSKEKKYLMAHVPSDVLPQIKTFMPGLSSPTVTTLFGDDKNVVIHVVVDKKDIYESIEKLKSLGGKGILIMTLDQMIA